MNPEIHIALVIEDESIDDKLLNSFHQVGATSFWRKGDFRGKSKATHDNSGCAFKVQPISGLSVEDTMECLWDSFNLEEARLLEIVQEHNLAPVLSIVIYASDIVPSIHLSCEGVKKLSKFNAEIDIDVILIE